MDKSKTKKLMESAYEPKLDAYLHGVGPRSSRRWFAIPKEDPGVEYLREAYEHLTPSSLIKMIALIFVWIAFAVVGIVLALWAYQWVYLLVFASMWAINPVLKRVFKKESKDLQSTRFRNIYLGLNTLVTLAMYAYGGWSLVWLFLFLLPTVGLGLLRFIAKPSDTMLNLSERINEYVLSHPEWEVTEQVLASRAAKNQIP